MDLMWLALPFLGLFSCFITRARFVRIGNLVLRESARERKRLGTHTPAYTPHVLVQPKGGADLHTECVLKGLASQSEQAQLRCCRIRKDSAGAAEPMLFLASPVPLLALSHSSIARMSKH